MNSFEQAFLDLTSDGSFFHVRFQKKDGTMRDMNARRGVSSYVTGEGLAYDPASKGLVGVWDAQAEGGEQHGYRMVNLSTIDYFNAQGQEFHRED